MKKMSAIVLAAILAISVTGLSADVCNMALRDAIEDGKLEKVYFADYEQQTFLGFVTLFKVTAYGE